MSQLNLWKHVNNFPQHNPLTSFACLNPRGAKSSPHSPVRRRQTRSCTHLTMSRLTITSCLESPGVVLVSSRAVTERNVLQMRFARAGCHICGHYWWCRPHWLSSDCSDWECNTRFALGFFSPPRRCGGCLLAGLPVYHNCRSWRGATAERSELSPAEICQCGELSHRYHSPHTTHHMLIAYMNT